MIQLFHNFTDIKAVSQIFENFKSTDSFTISAIFSEQFYYRYYKRYLQFRLSCD